MQLTITLTYTVDLPYTDDWCDGCNGPCLGDDEYVTNVEAAAEIQNAVTNGDCGACYYDVCQRHCPGKGLKHPDYGLLTCGICHWDEAF